MLNPASGTALVFSGDDCKLKGTLTLTPAAAQIGILVSGNRCQIDDAVVLTGATGIKITGANCTITNLSCGLQTAIGYDIQGEKTKLYTCHTVGNTTTIGFKISGGVDVGVLKNCTSSGHQTSGFYIDTLSANWSLIDCSSGGNDGRWVDVDSNNVWSGFTFDNEIVHLTTFSGGGGSADNLFKVTGAVEIEYIFGDVTTALSADVDNLFLDLYDGTASIEITDNGGGGVDSNSADVGSIFAKTEIATSLLTMLKSNQGRIAENSNSRKARVPFIVNQKSGVDTFIRCVYSGVATSGAIHWHCRWSPISDDGFLIAV